jgi:eukaryotic-like serine/threonine-protein kinase
MTGGGPATRVGELVGAKYRIVRLLAQGGMGVVYEAQHTVVRRRFAVKFLRRDLAERRDILTRFHHEAEAAGALESEHVAAAVDFGIAEDGAPYIVMEYLVGESLTSLLGREGQLPVCRAADLVTQAARGIQVAHAAGIIHRDLKPQNLFLCRREDGTDLVKVLDFGVAKLQAAGEMNAATLTGAMVGTVAYMSPEQARGDRDIDTRSDIYALGAILYELCTGRKPHPGESPNAILHHIATQPAVPLATVAPDLAPAFIELVSRALAADPQARPASADALAEALGAFSERKVWPAPKLEDSGASRTASPAPVPEAEPVRPRRRTWIAVAVAGTAAVVFAVAGVVRHRSSAEASPELVARQQVLPPSAPTASATGVALAASTSVAAPPAPPPPPSAGTGGAAPVRLSRRRPSATRPPVALPAVAGPAPATRPPVASPAKAPGVPVTFDQQNPYE